MPCGSAYRRPSLSSRYSTPVWMSLAPSTVGSGMPATASTGHRLKPRIVVPLAAPLDGPDGLDGSTRAFSAWAFSSPRCPPRRAGYPWRLAARLRTIPPPSHLQARTPDVSSHDTTQQEARRATRRAGRNQAEPGRRSHARRAAWEPRRGFLRPRDPVASYILAIPRRPAAGWRVAIDSHGARHRIRGRASHTRGRVLVLVTERLELGRRHYGALDIATDRRDFRQEAPLLRSCRSGRDDLQCAAAITSRHGLRGRRR